MDLYASRPLSLAFLYISLFKYIRRNWLAEQKALYSGTMELFQNF